MATKAGQVSRTTLEAYEQLLEINAGYEHVIRSLTALRAHAAFDCDQLNRFRALAREARASTNSYLTGALEPNTEWIFAVLQRPCPNTIQLIPRMH